MSWPDQGVHCRDAQERQGWIKVVSVSFIQGENSGSAHKLHAPASRHLVEDRSFYAGPYTVDHVDVHGLSAVVEHCLRSGAGLRGQFVQ